MSTPIKLAASGAVIAASQALDRDYQINIAKALADGSVALDAELWLSPSATSTTVAGAVQIGHFKAFPGATDGLPGNPIGFSVSNGQYILAKFNDAGAGHELWVYLT